jgi:hypothetical protein
VRAEIAGQGDGRNAALGGAARADQ